jgi:hypothetical protein
MKRLVILGGGESGVGTAILGKKEGFEVFVSQWGGVSWVVNDPVFSAVCSLCAEWGIG